MSNRLALFTFFLYSVFPTMAQFSEKPTWRDEFKGNNLNTEIWKRSVSEPGVQLSGYCDDEANVFVKSGKLHLKLIKVDDIQKPYRSGRVETRKRYGIGYGKLEIRAKAETGKGVWPALWMRPYPDDKRSIRGEIDLLEYIDCWKDSLIQVNYHLWGNFRGKKKHHVQYPKQVKCKVSEWHIYTYEAYPNRMIIKVDNDVVYDMKKGDKGCEWPFGFDYQLMLAYAYGGWGASCGTDDSALPSEFIIDYVRFFKFIK